MRVLYRVTKDDGSLYGYGWWCPGCKERHHIPTTGEKAWGFDGNESAPTFTPSVLVHGHAATATCRATPRCHTFIRSGRIEFLGDCTHALAGQTVPMTEIEKNGFPPTTPVCP